MSQKRSSVAPDRALLDNFKRQKGNVIVDKEIEGKGRSVIANDNGVTNSSILLL